MILKALGIKIAETLLSEFIAEQGYGKLKTFLFPKKKNINRLTEIIQETAEEYEKINPIIEEYKFPFYHSQALIDEFNKYILFDKKNSVSLTDLYQKIDKNKNIIRPELEDLKLFYDMFIQKINKDKTLRIFYIEENYQERIYSISEEIINVGIEVKKIHDKLSFIPDTQWFKKQNELAISDLGARYTPELNFELDISRVFEGIGRTERFKDNIYKKIDILLIKGKKILKHNKNFNSSNKIIEEEKIKEIFNTYELCLKKIYGWLIKIDFSGINYIQIEEIKSGLQELLEKVEDVEKYYLVLQEEFRKENPEARETELPYKSELKEISETYFAISEFSGYLDGTEVKIANNPFLLIYGEAGIGKSHMLADVVFRRMSNGYESIFLLGQQFLTDEDPWTQIFRKLKMNVNTDNFLMELNTRAKDNKKKILIFIDAINEGRGKYFWPNYLNSFIKEIKEYEWLGLVLSIRTTYKKCIFGDKGNLNLIEQGLDGFDEQEYDASKLFFKYYKIELPTVPQLNQEFRNPLFLKLFCEGLKKSNLTRIPKELQGLSRIIDFYIKSINKELSKPNRCDYSDGINLIKKSIEALIRFKVLNDSKYMTYEKAYDIIDNEIGRYINGKGFIDQLLAEGILSKNMIWNSNGDEEIVYLAYEKFEDYFFANCLVENSKDLYNDFKKDGQYYKYINSQSMIYRNKGLIEVLFIIIPDLISKEFFDVAPDLMINSSVMESFISSFLWRGYHSINENTMKYVNKYVFKWPHIEELYWDTVISVSAYPNHPLNANYLHGYLSRFSMADRDADWTIYVNGRFYDDYSIKKLIDWAWSDEDKTHISDESMLLICVTLAWFLTSTNRKLRDYATKSLICLIESRMNLLLELLQKFENVNDPYVYERLFAVAYGSGVRTEQKVLLPQLCEYIFATIFDKEEVYPHVLLRDYARGLIEYTLNLGHTLSFDIELTKPPYKSRFAKKFPSLDFINSKYKYDYNSEGFKDHYWSQNTILMSMTPNDNGGYGDFGRYVFESAFDSWNIKSRNLSNLAITWIFDKFGYSAEKHGKYDRQIASHDRHSFKNERIGKKYQWIAFYEMIARVSDNFEMADKWSQKKLGYFEGPWNPYIRDIDPTILITKTKDDDIGSSPTWWNKLPNINWGKGHEEWIESVDDIPDFRDYINLVDDTGEEWLMLEGYPEWNEEKRLGEEEYSNNQKRLWSQIRGYIVKEVDYEKFIHWGTKQNFAGRWMPEAASHYELFSREYYWSSAHKHFMDDYYGGNEWSEVNNIDIKVMTTVEDYLWEEQYDYSKDDKINYLKPCSYIFNKMNLKYNKNEGEYLNQENEVVCFATNVYNNTYSAVLIKKEPFLKYLAENNLKIVWTLLGEKQIIGGNRYEDVYYSPLEFSACIYINREELEYELNVSK